MGSHRREGEDAMVALVQWAPLPLAMVVATGKQGEDGERRQNKGGEESVGSRQQRNSIPIITFKKQKHKVKHSARK